jgi:hypothetical protein
VEWFTHRWLKYAYAQPGRRRYGCAKGDPGHGSKGHSCGDRPGPDGDL